MPIVIHKLSCMVEVTLKNMVILLHSQIHEYGHVRNG